MPEDDSKFEQVDLYNEQQILADEARRQVQSEAEGFVANLLTEIGPPGANDSEPGEIAEVLRQLKAGEIPPQEAKTRAQAIYDRKNMYH